MYSFIEGKRSSLMESLGCSPPCSTPVTVDFSTAAQETEVAFQSSLTFTATSSNAAELKWLVNGELLGTGDTFTYLFTEAGEVTIRLEGNGTLGCGAAMTSRSYLVVCDNSADFTTTATRISQGDTVSYVAAALVSDSYAWTLEDEEISTGPEVIIPFLEAGIFRLCLTTTLDGCTTERCEVIYAAPPGTFSGEGCEASSFLATYANPIIGGELFHGAIALAADGSYWQTGAIRNSIQGQEGVLIRRLTATGEVQFTTVLTDFDGQSPSQVPSIRELSNGDLLLLVKAFGGLNDRGDYIVRFNLTTQQEVYRIRVPDSGSGQSVINLVSIPGQTDRFVVISQRLPFVENGGATVKTVLFDFDADAREFDNTWRYRAAGIPDKVHAIDHGLFMPDGTFRGIGTFETSAAFLGNRPGISVFSAPNIISDEFTFHIPQSTEAFLRGTQIILNQSGGWHTTHIGNYTGFINPGGISSFISYWSESDQIQWTRRYRPLGTYEFTIKGSVRIGETLYHTGFMDTDGITDLFCFATDLDGNIIWANTYATGLVYQFFTSIGPNTNNRIITDSSRITVPFNTSDNRLGLIVINLDGSLDDPCSIPVPIEIDVQDLMTRQDEYDNPDLIIGENKFRVPTRPTTLYEADRLNGCFEPCDIISENEEICGNNIDDDNNGFTDCEDPAIANDCCCRSAPFVILPPDTLVCLNDGFTLKPIAASDSLLLMWNTNEESDSIEITTPGTYFLTATDECGLSFTDSITITTYALPPVPTLGEDFLICENATFSLDAGPGYVRYLWPDLTNEKTATFDEPGTYSVQVFNECGDFVTDTINIGVAQETILDWPDSTGLCADENLLLSTPGFLTRQWFKDDELVCDGCLDSLISAPELGDTIRLAVVAQSSSSCISVDTAVIFQRTEGGDFLEVSICNGEQFSHADATFTESGEYFVANGCGTEDTIALTVISPEERYSLRAVAPRCPGEASGLILLEPTGSDAELYLNDNAISLNDSLTDLAAGNYQLRITDTNGCSFLEEITVPEKADFYVLLPPDTTLRIGDNLLINPTLFGLAENEATFRWEPISGLSCDTCARTLIQPNDDITYFLTVTNSSGCEKSAAISFLLDRRERLYVPSAFSPNGDGINDFFYPNCGPEVTEVLEFQVYDRWGGLKYSGKDLVPNDPTSGWDGRFGSRAQEPGVFIYRLSVRLLDGRSVQLAGDVTLMQ